MVVVEARNGRTRRAKITHADDAARNEAVTFLPRCGIPSSDRFGVDSGVGHSITGNLIEQLSDDRSTRAKKSSYTDSFTQDRAQTAIFAVSERSLPITVRL
jgi:hypothetical protein